jgi:hypothetical protein
MIDIKKIEAQAAAVLAAINLMAPALKLLAGIVPDPEKTAILKTVAAIEAIETTSPNLVANINAVVADIVAIVAAVSPVAPIPA